MSGRSDRRRVLVGAFGALGAAAGILAYWRTHGIYGQLRGDDLLSADVYNQLFVVAHSRTLGRVVAPVAGLALLLITAHRSPGDVTTPRSAQVTTALYGVSWLCMATGVVLSFGKVIGWFPEPVGWFGFAPGAGAVYVPSSDWSQMESGGVAMLVGIAFFTVGHLRENRMRSRRSVVVSFPVGVACIWSLLSSRPNVAFHHGRVPLVYVGLGIVSLMTMLRGLSKKSGVEAERLGVGLAVLVVLTVVVAG